MLKSAICLILRKENKILLMKRAGSGFMDGFYSLPAGHVDGNETLKVAIVRETKEEINIEINPEDLNLELTLHRNSKSGEYIDLFFSVSGYKNTIRINEPDKCHELDFFVVDDVKDKIVPYVEKSLRAIHDGLHYLEADWNIS